MDILDSLSVGNASATTVTANRFGKFDGTGQIAQCGAGDPADGVIQFTTDGGVTLMYDGILPIAAAGTLAASSEIAADANGRAVLAAGTNALGRLVNNTSASALDDVVEFQFYRRGQKDATAPALLAASGAIAVTPSATYVITKAGVAAMTLAAPTADGVKLVITSDTANAHTVTGTGNILDTGSASVLTATFAAFKGAGLTLYSYNSRWKVLSSIGVTFS